MCKQSLTMSLLKVLDHNNGIMTFLFIHRRRQQFFLVSSARQFRNCIRIGHQKSSKHHMCKQSLTMSLLKVLDHNNGIMTFLFIHRRRQQFFLVSSARQFRNCIRIGHQKSSKHHMCKQSLTMSLLKVLDHNNGIMTFLFIDFLFFFRDRLRY